MTTKFITINCSKRRLFWNTKSVQVNGSGCPFFQLFWNTILQIYLSSRWQVRKTPNCGHCCVTLPVLEQQFLHARTREIYFGAERPKIRPLGRSKTQRSRPTAQCCSRFGWKNYETSDPLNCLGPSIKHAAENVHFLAFSKKINGLQCSQ
jgi:hypothetical protein